MAYSHECSKNDDKIKRQRWQITLLFFVYREIKSTELFSALVQFWVFRRFIPPDIGI